ncbi:hypothetical protein Airi02_016950 [Actinoallomurus iriomotensis]|uniref:Polymorphic outer membrane protein n=2 Tax=Actinoallomurus iriomotensis TaxID=478107 RepID=A0A9W6VZD7_9ACTN|nr:hypothetical protein Airi02_016950 [Actinoallomurus iriomotensis]
MGSTMRKCGGIATAALMMTGMAAVQPAYARQVVRVPCSAPALVNAVAAANQTGEGVLVLDTGCNYVLTAPSATGRGPDGLLINADVELIGGSGTQISRSATAAPFRIIEVAAGAFLDLENTTITGGLTNNTVPSNDTGGGILNSRGTTTLFRSTITGNTADNGAGLSNDSGRLDLNQSSINDNTTRAGGGGGGGVYNDGALNMQNSVIRHNHANTNGGGLYNGQGGSTETVGSTVDLNTAGAQGGGVYNAPDGRLLLQSTNITLNSATSGGGIFNAGLPSRVNLIASAVVSNTPNNCVPVGTIRHCTG